MNPNRNRFQTISDVLSSPWGAARPIPAASAATDRVLKSTRLEDAIYADLRAGDGAMDEMETAAAERLASFPHLSRDVYQSFYSLMPRKNDPDALSVEARKFNAPILEQMMGAEDYPALKDVCEGRELPAYEAASEFTARIASDLDSLLEKMGGGKNALPTLEKLEAARDKAERALSELLEQREAGGGNERLDQALLTAANRAESKGRQAEAVSKQIDIRAAQSKETMAAAISAAAGDMARRFEALFGAEYAGQLAFRTINGICATVINYYARKKGASPFELVTSDAQLNGAIRDILIHAGADYPTELQIKDARTQITYCKNQMLTDAEIQNVKVEGLDFPALYAAYQAHLMQNRLMDYDDQMVFTYRIFRQYPDILTDFQRRYRYLCVDEAQDTSKIQHVILRLLAQTHRNIFMVGDEDQSIYGFRAAWPQALLEFEQTWPGAKVLLMETNYRSTGAIVERADAFIQRNRDRHPKHMRTDNPPGEPIRKIVLSDYNRQYNYLLKVARDCQKPTAVLFRNNDSALPVIDLLDREGVPFSCRQRESFFFSSPVVRDLTEILTFAFDGCDRDVFLRFYYKLDLKMKKTVLTGLLRYQKEGESVFDTLLESENLEPWQIGRIRAMQTHFSKLPQLSSFAALQRIVRYMGYGEYLNDQRMDASKLDVLLALANQTREPRAFLLRLQELRELAAEGSAADCPLVLSTIHASKGLEYDRVLLIDVADGVFPAVAEPEGGDISEEDRAALEEERRLFYVGATRAKHTLELLTYENKFGEPAGAYSTFAAQLLGEERPRPNPPPQAVIGAPKPKAKVNGPTAEQLDAWQKDYIPGTEVFHRRFGRGLLLERDGELAKVQFFDCGVKKLKLPDCLQKGLLALNSLDFI